MSRLHSVFCACLLAAWGVVAGAQGFGSVSSVADAAPEPSAPPAAAAVPAEVPAEVPADVRADVPADVVATPAPSPAFSSQPAGANPFLTGSAARAAASSTAPDAVAAAPVAADASSAADTTRAATTPVAATPVPDATVPEAAVASSSFSSVGAAPVDAAASNPFMAGSAAPAADATSNPFLTGSAAAAAAAASNPFLTESAARRLASTPGWTAPATATVAAATTPAAPTAAGSGPDLGASASAGSLAFGSSYAEAIAGPARIRAPADRILVKKSERRLYLLKGGQVIAEYPIRLGLNPTGPKRYEGDYRTPEGRYELVRRNSNSEFFLSLEVSYPNEQDLARARELGMPPGGLIMIHGQPNLPSKPAEYYQSNDWTNGCIAVSNADMVDIWLRTDLGTPIEIRP